MPRGPLGRTPRCETKTDRSQFVLRSRSGSGQRRGLTTTCMPRRAGTQWPPTGAPEAFAWRLCDGDCARRGCRALRPIEGTPAAHFVRFSGLCRKGKEPSTKLGGHKPRTTVRPPCGANLRQPLTSAHHSNWAPCTRQRGEAGGGRPGQHAEGWSTGASCTRVVDDLTVVGNGQQRPKNDLRNNQYNPSAPTTGLRKREGGAGLAAVHGAPINKSFCAHCLMLSLLNSSTRL